LELTLQKDWGLDAWDLPEVLMQRWKLSGALEERKYFSPSRRDTPPDPLESKHQGKSFRVVTANTRGCRAFTEMGKTYFHRITE